MPSYDNTDIQNLENRVDNIENRVSRLETSLEDLKASCSTGFQDLKNTLQNLYAERSEWGKFARQALSSVGKWCAKYGAVIVCAAIGLGNLDKILKVFGL